MRTVLRYSFTTLHRIGFINMKDYDCERKNKLHGIYVMIQHCILLSVICAHFLSMVTRAKRYLPELLQVVIEHTIAVSFYVVVFYANLKVPTLHVIQDYADNIFSKADMKIVRKWNRRGKMAYFIIFVLCVGVVIANILEAIIPLSEKEVEIRRKVYQNSHPEKRHPLTVWLIFFDESVGWNYIAIFIWQLYYFVFLTFIGVGIMSTVPICTFELEGQYEMLCQDLMLLGKRSVEEDMKIGKNTSENKRLGAIVSRISVRDEAQRREKIKERHERQLLRHIVKTHHTLLDFQDKLTELLAPAIIALVLCTNITFSLCLYQLFINLEEHSGIRFYKTFMLFCELTDISLIMDLTYSGWGVVKKFCELSGIHYIRFDVTIQPYLNMVVDFLENLRNSTDATFVFDTVIGQRQGLSYLLRNSRMRISTFAALTNDVIRSLRTRNPYPTFIVLIAKENLIKTDESLVLLPTNMLSVKIKMPKTFAYNVTIFQTQQSLCCYLQENTRTCTCNLMSKFQLLTALISKYANVLNKMLTDLNKSNFLNPRDIHCQVEEDGALTVPDMDVKDRKPLNHLYVFQALQNNPPLMFSENTSLISYKLDLNMSTWIAPNRSLIQLGTYNTQNGFNTSRSVEKIPRYFRIGSVVSIPWTMPVRDPLTGYIMRDYQDREMYQGYCIDLINELAKTMNFQYELVIASRFGKKLANNSWTGLVGMLMRGVAQNIDLRDLRGA
ncbi:hypothetical protein M8J76_001478 [Diaphorina citri]|nr:hypothetical protein M8J76_001478 [Diaphorina citri]